MSLVSLFIISVCLCSFSSFDFTSFITSLHLPFSIKFFATSFILGFRCILCAKLEISGISFLIFVTFVLKLILVSKPSLSVILFSIYIIFVLKPIFLTTVLVSGIFYLYQHLHSIFPDFVYQYHIVIYQ